MSTPPKLPRPPLTGNKELDDWTTRLYMWVGQGQFAGVVDANGVMVARAAKPPSPPVIAEQLLSIPIGLEFKFNFNQSEVVDGYWIYKGSTSDPEAANKYKWVPQSAEGGIYTFQDTVGTNSFYYWIAAQNSVGKSNKVYAGAPGAAPPPPLTSTETMTVYRPSVGSGDYASPGAAFDANLNVGAVLASSIDPGVSLSSTWSGISAASGTPSAVTLCISSAVTAANTATITVSYSTNGGSTWANVYSTSAVGARTDRVTLAPGQDLTQLLVKSSADNAHSGAAQAQHTIYEIWAEVTT